MTNRRFSTDLKNLDFSEFSETRIDPGETHIMRIVIFHALYVYFAYRKNTHILQLSQFVLVAHELYHFRKNVMPNLLTK
jgi:hypothetical protein